MEVANATFSPPPPLPLPLLPPRLSPPPGCLKLLQEEQCFLPKALGSWIPTAALTKLCQQTHWWASQRYQDLLVSRGPITLLNKDRHTGTL